MSTPDPTTSTPEPTRPAAIKRFQDDAPEEANDVDPKRVREEEQQSAEGPPEDTSNATVFQLKYRLSAVELERDGYQSELRQARHEQEAAEEKQFFERSTLEAEVEEKNCEVQKLKAQNKEQVQQLEYLNGLTGEVYGDGQSGQSQQSPREFRQPKSGFSGAKVKQLEDEIKQVKKDRPFEGVTPVTQRQWREVKEEVVELRKNAPVLNEHGEPLTQWQFKNLLDGSNRSQSKVFELHREIRKLGAELQDPSSIIPKDKRTGQPVTQELVDSLTKADPILKADGSPLTKKDWDREKSAHNVTKKQLQKMEKNIPTWNGKPISEGEYADMELKLRCAESNIRNRNKQNSLLDEAVKKGQRENTDLKNKCNGVIGEWETECKRLSNLVLDRESRIVLDPEQPAAAPRSLTQNRLNEITFEHPIQKTTPPTLLKRSELETMMNTARRIEEERDELRKTNIRLQSKLEEGGEASVIRDSRGEIVSQAKFDEDMVVKTRAEEKCKAQGDDIRDRDSSAERQTKSISKLEREAVDRDEQLRLLRQENGEVQSELENVNSEVEKRVEKVEGQKNKAEKAAEELKEQANDAKREAGKLNIHNEQVREEIEKLRTAKDEEQEVREKKEEELRLNTQKIEDLETDKAALHRNQEQLQKKLRKLEDKCPSCETLMDQLASKRQEVEDAQKQLTLSNDLHQNQIDEFREKKTKESREHQEQLETKDKELQKQRKEAHKRQEKLGAKDKDLEEKAQQIATKEQAIKVEKDKRAELERQLSDAMATPETQFIQEGAEKGYLAGQLSTKAKRESDLEKQLAEKQDEKVALEKQLQQTTKVLTETSHELDVLKQQMADSGDNDPRTDKIEKAFEEKYKKTIDGLELDLLNFEAEKQGLMKTLGEFTKLPSEFPDMEEMKEFCYKWQKLVESNTALEQQIRTLQESRDIAVKQKIDHTDKGKEEILRAEETIMRLEKDVESLIEQAAGKAEINDKLTQGTQSLEISHEALKEEHEGLKDDARNLLETINGLKKDIKSIEKALMAKTTECEKLEAKVEKLEDPTAPESAFRMTITDYNAEMSQLDTIAEDDEDDLPKEAIRTPPGRFALPTEISTSCPVLPVIDHEPCHDVAAIDVPQSSSSVDTVILGSHRPNTETVQPPANPVETARGQEADIDVATADGEGNLGGNEDKETPRITPRSTQASSANTGTRSLGRRLLYGGLIMLLLLLLVCGLSWFVSEQRKESLLAGGDEVARLALLSLRAGGGTGTSWPSFMYDDKLLAVGGGVYG